MRKNLRLKLSLCMLWCHGLFLLSSPGSCILSPVFCLQKFFQFAFDETLRLGADNRCSPPYPPLKRIRVGYSGFRIEQASWRFLSTSILANFISRHKPWRVPRQRELSSGRGHTTPPKNRPRAGIVEFTTSESKVSSVTCNKSDMEILLSFRRISYFY